MEVYKDPNEPGGDPSLQEHPIPHPLNLHGQQFQDELKTDISALGKWLQKFGIDNIGMALNDLRKLIAPDPPFSVPEGFPLSWEIMTSYRFMLSFFKKQDVTTLRMDKPKPPGVFTVPKSDTDFGPPDTTGLHPNDDPVSQGCELILALLDWVFKTLTKVAEFLYEVGKMLLSALSWPGREALYKFVTLPLWVATERIRMVLVPLSYMQPQGEQRYDDNELKHPKEIDEILVTLGHSVNSAFQEAISSAIDVLGNIDLDPSLTNVAVRNVPSDENPWLPIRALKGESIAAFRKAIGDDVLEYTRPWAFPNINNQKDRNKAGNYLEMPRTISGPYVTETMPHDLMVTDQSISNEARKHYEAANCPDETDILNYFYILNQDKGRFTQGLSSFDGNNPLGDPIVMSTYLIGQIANNPKFLSSFNLDADKGYGYLCWDWKRDQNTTTTDERGHPYAVPKVTTEGDPSWLRPDPVMVGLNEYKGTDQLELLYPERRCPAPPQGGGDGPPIPR